MSDEPRCEEVRQLLAELALGIATGEERARALDHIAGCPRCRRCLAEVAEVADELLLLAPTAEPPIGFESGVLERLEAETRRRRRRRSQRPRWRRALAPVAAALAAAAAALAGVYVATDDDRDAASAYRRALQQAHGSYFGALPLREPGGRRAGLVFGYAGSPSWLFVLVQRNRGSGRWDIELQTKNGERIRLGSFEVDRGSGSLGRTIPVPLRDVARVMVLERSGRGRLTAVARPG
jgi:Putative zinc-finger